MPQTIPGFEGTLIGPDDDGYDTHREVWNAVVDRRPALIARCTSAADVAAAIGFARQHDLEIGVKCGGHGVLGLSVPQDGLMIDLTPMGEVRVDPTARRAVVGGGALLRSLDRAAQEHGLATTAGNVSHTGVGGLTLGGGMGWLARQAGLACDNVEAYTVVTGRRRDRPRHGDGPPRPVLGAARRGRQLRRCDRVRVPPPSGGRARAGGGAHLRRGGRRRADAPLARPPAPMHHAPQRSRLMW